MKKMILILGALLAAFGVIKAQDTIRYPDSCYMYNPLEFDSVLGLSAGPAFEVCARASFYNSGGADSEYMANNGYERVLDPMTGRYVWLIDGPHPTYGIYSEYVAPSQTWIYGIAATTGGGPYRNWGRYLDSIYTRAERLNISYITDSNFNLYAYVYGVSNGEVYCIDSVKWIRHNNPYRYFAYQQYPARGFESFDHSPLVTYSYEFYFDKPVSVTDTFLIGVRYPNANGLLVCHAWWSPTVSTCSNYLGFYYNYDDGARDYEIDFCNHHMRMSRGPWGGYFPILTPRDTTRCDPVREVSMFTATDTSITLTWRADNATQWEVEYAEADGMTAYTITTTTPRVTLTGLRPTTTYLAHVRAWCTRDSEYGEWSPFVEAQTTVHQQPDTTQGPDTVKIDAVGLFTRLMPNPTRGLVTVQSAYSLNHVALYDMQGRLMLEQKAAGNAATFDVGTLPKGVYMVTVRTVAGTTTKRLLVE